MPGSSPTRPPVARAAPIYQTTSFVFDSADHAASLFNLQTFGNVYSRITNPTVAVLEERVAALEGGRAALATASGMAAQMTGILTIVQPGDHIVASTLLYGGTYSQFAVTLPQFGIETTFVDPDEPENFRRAIRPNTQLPLRRDARQPADQRARHRSGRRHRARARRAADDRQHAGLALPCAARSSSGADIVVHSATKYLGGHGTTMGGVMVEVRQVSAGATATSPR